MKGKLILVLLLTLIFAGFIGVKFFLLDSRNATGQLKIASSPQTSIFIDNMAVGNTPYEKEAKPGEYLIKLIPDGNASDTASWQGKVMVNRNSLTYVNRELGSTDVNSAGEIFLMTKMDKPGKSGQHGELLVETEPSGAIVYLDNDEKGIGTLTIQDVLKGEHELSVFLPGFFRRTQKINIEGGYRLNATVKLAMDQSQQNKSNQEEEKESSESAKTDSKTMVTIKDTPLGYLRVRDEGNLNASESGRVKPGEEYEFIEENDDGWYKIKLDEGKEGWVSSVYAEKE
jgi:hypothetical protein